MVTSNNLPRERLVVDQSASVFPVTHSCSQLLECLQLFQEIFFNILVEILSSYWILTDEHLSMLQRFSHFPANSLKLFVRTFAHFLSKSALPDCVFSRVYSFICF